MFSHLSVSHSVHRGQGRAWQGACMAGGCVWQGACVAGGGSSVAGGMHVRGEAGAWMTGDGVAGGVHGRGHAWWGMHGRG